MKEQDKLEKLGSPKQRAMSSCSGGIERDRCRDRAGKTWDSADPALGQQGAVPGVGGDRPVCSLLRRCIRTGYRSIPAASASTQIRYADLPKLTDFLSIVLMFLKQLPRMFGINFCDLEHKAQSRYYSISQLS